MSNLRLPLDVLDRIAQTLYTTQSLGTLSALQHTSHQLYDLISPYLYSKLTLDDRTIICLFDLSPRFGSRRLPSGISPTVYHKRHEHPKHVLIQCKLSITTKAASVNERRLRLLQCVRTIEMTKRLDPTVCEKVLAYLVRSPSPFPNVDKVVLGFELLFEIFLYHDIATYVHNTAYRELPVLDVLRQLVYPTSLCIVCTPACTEQYHYLFIAWAWDDYPEDDPDIDEGYEGISDQASDLIHSYKRDSFSKAVELLCTSWRLKQVVTHDILDGFVPVVPGAHHVYAFTDREPASDEDDYVYFFSRSYRNWKQLRLDQLLHVLDSAAVQTSTFKLIGAYSTPYMRRSLDDHSAYPVDVMMKTKSKTATELEEKVQSELDSRGIDPSKFVVLDKDTEACTACGR